MSGTALSNFSGIYSEKVGNKKVQSGKTYQKPAVGADDMSYKDMLSSFMEDDGKKSKNNGNNSRNSASDNAATSHVAAKSTGNTLGLEWLNIKCENCYIANIRLGPGGSNPFINTTIAQKLNDTYAIDKDGNVVTIDGSEKVKGWIGSNGNVDTDVEPQELNVKPSKTIPPQATKKVNFSNNFDAGTKVINKISVNGSPIQGNTVTASVENPVTIELSNGETQTVTNGTYGIGQSMPITMTIPMYDSLGNSHTVPVYAVKTNSDSTGSEWTISLNQDMSKNTKTIYGDDGNNLTVQMDSVKLNFDTKGDYDVVRNNSARMTIIGSGIDKQEITFDFSKVTQYAGNTTINSTSDGTTAGKLKDVSVNKDGDIVSRYSNGIMIIDGRIQKEIIPIEEKNNIMIENIKNDSDIYDKEYADKEIVEVPFLRKNDNSYNTTIEKGYIYDKKTEKIVAEVENSTQISRYAFDDEQIIRVYSKGENKIKISGDVIFATNLNEGVIIDGNSNDVKAYGDSIVNGNDNTLTITNADSEIHGDRNTIKITHNKNNEFVNISVTGKENTIISDDFAKIRLKLENDIYNYEAMDMYMPKGILIRSKEYDNDIEYVLLEGKNAEDIIISYGKNQEEIKLSEYIKEVNKQNEELKPKQKPIEVTFGRADYQYYRVEERGAVIHGQTNGTFHLIDSDLYEDYDVSKQTSGFDTVSKITLSENTGTRRIITNDWRSDTRIVLPKDLSNYTAYIDNNGLGIIEDNEDNNWRLEIEQNSGTLRIANIFWNYYDGLTLSQFVNKYKKEYGTGEKPEIINVPIDIPTNIIKEEPKDIQPLVEEKIKKNKTLTEKDILVARMDDAYNEKKTKILDKITNLLSQDTSRDIQKYNKFIAERNKAIKEAESWIKTINGEKIDIPDKIKKDIAEKIIDELTNVELTQEDFTNNNGFGLLTKVNTYVKNINNFEIEGTLRNGHSYSVRREYGASFAGNTMGIYEVIWQDNISTVSTSGVGGQHKETIMVDNSGSKKSIDGLKHLLEVANDIHKESWKDVLSEFASIGISEFIDGSNEVKKQLSNGMWKNYFPNSSQKYSDTIASAVIYITEAAMDDNSAKKLVNNMKNLVLDQFGYDVYKNFVQADSQSKLMDFFDKYLPEQQGKKLKKYVEELRKIARAYEEVKNDLNEDEAIVYTKTMEKFLKM